MPESLPDAAPADTVLDRKAQQLARQLVASLEDTVALYQLPASLTGDAPIWVCAHDGAYYVAAAIGTDTSPSALYASHRSRDMVAAGILPGTEQTYVVNVPHGRDIIWGLVKDAIRTLLPFTRRHDDPLAALPMEPNQWVKLSPARGEQIRRFLESAPTTPQNPSELDALEQKAREVITEAPDELSTLDVLARSELLAAIEIHNRLHAIRHAHAAKVIHQFYPIHMPASHMAPCLQGAVDATKCRDMAALPVDLTLLQHVADRHEQAFDRVANYRLSDQGTPVIRSTLYAAPLAETALPPPPHCTLYTLSSSALPEKRSPLLFWKRFRGGINGSASPLTVMHHGDRWYVAAAPAAHLSRMGSWRDVTDAWGAALTASADASDNAHSALTPLERLDLTPDDDRQYNTDTRREPVPVAVQLQPVLSELQREDGMRPATLNPAGRTTAPLHQYDTNILEHLEQRMSPAAAPIQNTDATQAPALTPSRTQSTERAQHVARSRPTHRPAPRQSASGPAQAITFVAATVALVGISYVGIQGMRKLGEMLSNVSDSLLGTPAQHADLSPLMHNAQSPPSLHAA